MHTVFSSAIDNTAYQSSYSLTARPIGNLGDLAREMKDAGRFNQDATVTAVLHLQGALGPQSPGLITGVEISDDEGLFGSTVIFHVKFDIPQINHADMVALQVCQAMGIQIAGSLNQWAWRLPNSLESQINFYETKIDAARAAVCEFFPKSNWRQHVNSNLTQMGYMEWALKEAMLKVEERAC